MDVDTRRALEAIDRVCESPMPADPVVLDTDYLKHLERVEALPDNRPLADKSWVRRVVSTAIESWRTAVEA